MLREVRIDWGAASLAASVETATGRGEILATGLTLFRCPHHQPWGPSASINFVTSRTTGDLISGLRLEMQSGDLLEIEATSITYGELPTRLA